ncbi:hypothetical protein [uncultured Propionibacterium sp.]|uniref:hypothetical protein n=1 Tax=uncultured Propionibacterium sp. TaxID=218066 RepID=UPI002931E040|nr:hypothetical protein [uncultured Propionibacterium sp.]
MVAPALSSHREEAPTGESPLVAWRAAVAMEAIKILTLRSWWIGLIVVSALNVYFAYNGVILAREALPTFHDGMVLDDLGASVPLDRYVDDMILSAPYQSMAVFFPLLLILACGQDYRSGRGQFQLMTLAVPSRIRLATARIAFALVATVGSTIVVFLLSDAVLWFMLPAPVRAVVISVAGALVCLRIMLVACVMAVTALAATMLTRSTFGGAMFIVAQAVVSVSGLLRIIGQGANNALPMVAAKTFLFGYQREAGEPGAAAGMMILAVWLGVSVLAVMIHDTRRETV